MLSVISAIEIREEKEIKGMQIRTIADDMVIYIENPKEYNNNKKPPDTNI